MVGGVASTPNDVARYVACTLLAASLQPGDESSAALITSCLTFLEDNEFVTLRSVQNAGELTNTLSVLYTDTVIQTTKGSEEQPVIYCEAHSVSICFVVKSVYFSHPSQGNSANC